MKNNIITAIEDRAVGLEIEIFKYLKLEKGLDVDEGRNIFSSFHPDTEYTTFYRELVIITEKIISVSTNPNSMVISTKSFTITLECEGGIEMEYIEEK